MSGFQKLTVYKHILVSGTAVITIKIFMKACCYAVFTGCQSTFNSIAVYALYLYAFCESMRSARPAKNLPFGRTRMRAQRLYPFEHCVRPHCKYHGTLVELQRLKSWHRRRIHSALRAVTGIIEKRLLFCELVNAGTTQVQ